MKDLKSCPFCGCSMEVETIGRDWWRIKPIHGHDDLCPMLDNEYNCGQCVPVDEHIDDWNMRVDYSMVDGKQLVSEKAIAYLHDNHPEIYDAFYKLV